MSQPDLQYTDYEGTIMDRCWFIHIAFGIDIDELRSESSVIYMKAVEKWRPKRSAFNTFLYRMLTNELITFAMRYIKSPLVEGEWDPDSVRTLGWGNPYRRMAWLDLLDSLSGEARYVADLFLDGPTAALKLKGNETPHQIRGKLRVHLTHDLGWSHYRATETIKELKQAMA